MPADIEEFAVRQAIRRRGANRDAALAVFGEVLTAAALLWIQVRYFGEESIWHTILLILAVSDAALAIPILIVRHQRIKEIAGGEEDEARQY